jgi:hypothetical protein
MRLTAIVFLLPALLLPIAGSEAEVGGVVGNGGVRLFTVAAVPGYTAAQRVEVIQKRLIDILSSIRKGQDPGVAVRVEDGAPVIYVRGLQLVTVTWRDGQLHSTPPQQLATFWADVLRTKLPVIAPDTAGGARDTWAR